jgi:hypothetical protein
MTKILFLDTNVYLHYKLFDEVDWQKIAQGDEVNIVVPPITIRELNKNKETHSQTRVRKRAATVLQKLGALFEVSSVASIGEKVLIGLEDRDPNIDFAQYQLNREVQDDNLIASILMYTQEATDADVLLVTADTGLSLLAKARRLGIKPLKLPTSLKLPEELDPEQEKIKKLEATIRELRSKSPQLALVFEGGKQHTEFALSEPEPITQEELDRRIEELKQRYPALDADKDKSPDPESPQARIARDFFAGLKPFDISSEDIADYNHGLDVFYEAYRTYLQKSSDYRKLRAIAVKLEIWVRNSGTAPADDVDIFMHFPDGFNVMDEENYPTPPNAPKPPPKPKNQFQKIANSPIYSIPPSVYESLGSVDTPLSNVSSFNIKRTKSYDVDFSIQRLKHKLAVCADPLYIAFSSYENAQSFQIEYHILGATPPYESSGVLHVVIKKA